LKTVAKTPAAASSALGQHRRGGTDRDKIYSRILLGFAYFLSFFPSGIKYYDVFYIFSFPIREKRFLF